MKGSIAALAALCALVLAIPAGASNSATYADSVGENPAAPDITSIVVSNDDGGLITFQVNVSNRPALTSDMLFLIFLDTDQNASTGDTENLGAEYAIQLLPGEVDLFKWNGSDYTAAPSQSSLVFAYGTGGPTIKIKASDLGGIKAFNFVVIAVSGIATDATGNPDFTNAKADVAPDPGHGSYAYQVKTTLVLTMSSFTTAPATVRAGSTLSATAGITENDTGGPLQAGFTSCHAVVAGRVLLVTSSGVANGVAACTWRVPKKTKGKTVTGTLTVTYNGAKVSRTFSAKIH